MSNFFVVVVEKFFIFLSPRHVLVFAVPGACCSFADNNQKFSFGVRTLRSLGAGR